MTNSPDILNQVQTQMLNLLRLLNNEDSDISIITSKSNVLIESLNQLNDFLTRDISEFDYYATIIDKYGLNTIEELNGNPTTTVELLEYFDGRLPIQMWRMLFGAAARALTITYFKTYQEKAPEDVLQTFKFLINLHNNSEYVRKTDLWELYIPKLGSSFERSKQISTVDVIGGEIIDVYLPGMADMRGKVIAKAIVVVRT